jgi:hypothetical protein
VRQVFFGSVSTRRRVVNSCRACDLCSVIGSCQTVILIRSSSPDPINIAERKAIPRITEFLETVWVEKLGRIRGLFFTRPKTRPHQLARIETGMVNFEQTPGAPRSHNSAHGDRSRVSHSAADPGALSQIVRQRHDGRRTTRVFPS